MKILRFEAVAFFADEIFGWDFPVVEENHVRIYSFPPHLSI
jgi:hypothetical protein